MTGCAIRFMVDDTKPTNTTDHHWAETSYDGKLDSWIPDIPRHWHKHHDEYMQVLSGRIAFTLDSESVILTPEMGVLHIPRLHVHGFKFFAGEAAAFTEKTDPPGDFKQEFFEDIFEAGQPTFATSMRAFYDGDTYLECPGGFSMVDVVVTTVIGAAMTYLYPRKGAVVPSGSVAALT
ncbi:hypothetical protein LTR08_004276 [Meristemomyces frigidus]|nr:hypothetical protein LTR08_004276 [Meristemomyces frigidus]